MKILILTQWFDPEPNIKGMLFAKELVARGHQVEVLTGFPNYPGGAVYPGYRIRLWSREKIDGVDVLRVALYPSHNNSAIRRAFNYLSFAMSAIVIGTALIRRPDVIYVYHPPITVGLAGYIIGRLRRAPFLYDVQDLWPDTVAASGMMSDSAALRVLGWICAFVYGRASRIAVLSNGFKDSLVQRGVAPGRIEVIYNWSDEKTLQTSSGGVPRLSAGGRFGILFAGTMGKAQDLGNVLKAAEICQRKLLPVDFLFIGGGVERDHLEKMAEEMRLDNVRFLPRQPMEKMGKILAGADVLLVHLKDDPLFRITIPSKTQAYLAAGKPILMGVRGDAAELIQRSQSGVLCEPGNPESIASAVDVLLRLEPEQLSSMGRMGRAFYERELSVAAGVDKFERAFQAILLNNRLLRVLQNPR